MTIRGPLSEVISTNIAQPSLSTLFVVVDNGVEGNLTVETAISLLGTKGDKGDPGRVGYTGSTGTQGIQGFLGSRGDSGYTGSVGFTGSQGYTGSTGTQGTTGFAGSRGYFGSTGYTGSRGVPGYTGSTGTQGNVGFVGSAGKAAEFNNTVTNLAWGSAGQIPIQYDTSSTTFIEGGNPGDLLRYGINTASWVSTASVVVGGALSAITSDREFINSLTAAEITPTRYLTMASGSNNYAAIGASSNLFYHTNNKVLTSPGILVSAVTSATNTVTGALIVRGGVGIGGDVNIGNNLNVRGTITAKQLTIEYTTITYSSTVLDDIVTITNSTNATDSESGALVVAGGVGIKKDLYVGGVIYGTLQGSINIASNLAGGGPGQLPFQTDANLTAFIGAGTAGQVLISNGASPVGPVFRNTSTLIVGYAANLLGGTNYAIPYQLTPGSTRFLPNGISGQVLTSRGALGLTWGSLTDLVTGNATTSTNLAGGTTGQVPYQINSGITGFYGPGNAGDILISRGPNSPLYVGTGTIYVGRAVIGDNLPGGSAGYIPIQSGNGKTAFISTGSVGSILTMQSGNTATWTPLSGFAVGVANTATNLANGGPGQLAYQSAPGNTLFVSTGTQGQLLISNGTLSPSWISTSSLRAGYARNLLGGSQGALPVQTNIDSTAFIDLGANGYILTAGATSPTWLNPSSLSIGNANTSTNLKGGETGSIPIQASNGITSFIPLGTEGYILLAGATTATWGTVSVLTVSTASNLALGSAGRVPYQISLGKTGFTNSGTVGQVFISGGTGSPTWLSTSSLWAGRASIAEDLNGGALGSIPIQSGPNSTSYIPIGDVSTVLVSDGTTATWTPLSGIATGISTTSTNLANGDAGKVPYQTAPGKTSFSNSGTVGQVFISGGTGSPTWLSTGSLYAGNAVKSLEAKNADQADNLNYGSIGAIPIQSNSSSTSFIGLGNVGSFLTVAINNTATWLDPINLVIGNATTASNLASGDAGKVPYQTAPGKTSFSNSGTVGQVFISGGTESPIWLSTGSLYVGNAVNAELASNANKASNLNGGSLGSIPIQNGADSTAFITLGNVGSFLTVAINNTATWVDPINLVIGNASTSTNLASGDAGKVPYQTAPGKTSFTNSGTVGQVFVSGGTGSPTWLSTGSLYVGNAVRAEIANNLSGGKQGFIPIQNGIDSTAFIGTGTIGTVLQMTSVTTATWSFLSELVVGNANTSTNISGGDAGKVPYQSAPGRTSFSNSGTIGQVFISGGTGSPTWLSTGSLYVGNAVRAEIANNANQSNNLNGGSTGSIPIQSATSATAFIPIGATGQVLTVGANNTATWKDLAGLSAGYATTATNLADGNAGQLPYQTAPGRTGFSNSGTTGQVLLSGGIGSPTWISTGSLYVGYAFSAGSSSNIVGGVIGQIHIQSGVGTTAFISTGTYGQILVAGLNTATWKDATGLLVGNATNLDGGSAGRVVYQSGVGLTSFTNSGTVGQVFISGGIGSPTWLSTGSLYVGYAFSAGSSSNIVGGAAGSIPLQSSPGVTSYIPIGSTGQILTVGTNNTATWSSLSSLTAGNATTATNIAGGAIGQLHIQSGPGQTAFISPGNDKTLLQYNGATNTATWVSTGTLTVANATYATNITGGAAGSIPLQSSPGVTSYIPIGSTGQILTVGTGNTATWSSLSSLTAGNATTATNIAGGAIGQLHIQSGPGQTAFVITGNTGNLLQYNATNNTATWISTSTLSVGFANTSTNSIYATTATNIAGGIAGSIHIQSGSGQTAFIPLGTSGYVLTAGTTTATWAAVSSLGAGSATTASQVQTVQQITNAVHYPTFVNANNIAGNGMSVYTTSSFVINPSTGYHGIGTGTPGQTLDVSNAGSSQLRLGYSSAGAVYSYDMGRETTLGYLRFYGNQTTAVGYIFTGIDGERMRINAGGLVGINTSTPASLLDVNGTAIVRGNFTATGALSVGAQVTAPAGVAGEIRATNEITAYYGSDARLKENVKPIEDPITMIKKIRGVYFDWTDEHIERRGGEDGYFVRKNDIGVIAQEVESILPEIVANRDDGFKAVKYEKMVPLLIEAIKAQQKQIDQLSEMVNTLTNK